MIAGFETADDVSETSSEIKLITPVYAQLVLARYRYERQRPLRDVWVDYLAEEMRRGRFKLTTIEFAMTNDTRLQLINGQHTLAAIIRCQQAQTLNVVTHMVDGQDAVDHLYARCDAGGKRTPAQVYKALQMDRILNLSSQTDLNAVASAVRFIESRFGASRPQVNPEAISDRMVEYGEAMHQFIALTNSAGVPLYSRLRRGSVLGVALLTLADANSDADKRLGHEFWRGAAMDDGLGRGDPRWHFVRYLRESVLSISAKGGRSVSARYDACYTTACWNYWVLGKRDVKLVKVADITRPLLIRHTRFASCITIDDSPGSV